ncbi:retrieval of early ER protein Rer1 [Piromyces finnis]|uniref:Protein RER1 n=1 Tax=Piromyces finnis TaxID=1754191 RepID=A0A1Y1VJI9_9FUNG|nr:retrieval of early ER protein Rer1 [Piromyces finnis]|eukprot:ORX57880.1 retrieval of early ER protein Rer1 [Piromyces finnis]
MDIANSSKPSKFKKLYRSLMQKYNNTIGVLTPYTLYRWIFTISFIIIYLIRTLMLHGWFIVTYALGIYLLNIFLAFLSPKFDPALEMDDEDEYEDEDEEGLSLPVHEDDEFKPFIRKLPEFKFWHSATKAVLLAFFCTFFDCLDIPVFWPILLIYFFGLFGVTMKRQIKHMIKYKYIPINIGKKHYTTERSCE